MLYEPPTTSWPASSAMPSESVCIVTGSVEPLAKALPSAGVTWNVAPASGVCPSSATFARARRVCWSAAVSVTPSPATW